MGKTTEPPHTATKIPESMNTPPRGQPSPRRVLIIEDNVDAANTLREILLFGDHEIAVAHNGIEGLAEARAFGPELILCDIGLPCIDGYAVARTLTDEAIGTTAYLVALSGYAMPEDCQRAIAAGFDEHLTKPPNLDTLNKLLCELSAKRTAKISIHSAQEEVC